MSSQQVRNGLMNLIQMTPQDEIAETFNEYHVLQFMGRLTPDHLAEVLIAKNIKHYGDINTYITSFVAQLNERIPAMPEGPQKEQVKVGQREFVRRLLRTPGISDANRQELERMAGVVLAAAAAGGRRRKTRRSKTLRRRR